MLSTFELFGCSIYPSELSVLPKSLTTLRIEVQERPESENYELKLSHFPRSLTNLNLITNLALENESNRAYSLPPLVRFAYSTTTNAKTLIDPKLIRSFPSLEELDLPSDALALTWDFHDLSLPPRLTYLKVFHWYCDWFHYLPRGLKTFESTYLLGIPDCPLTAQGLLFSDLPATLERFRVVSHLQIDEPFDLPVQSFAHLTSLKTLILRLGYHMPFSILKMIPQSIHHLDLELLKEFDNETDLSCLPYLPPRLSYLSIGREIPIEFIPYMPLASLTSIRPWGKALQIARERVTDVLKHP